MIVCLNPGWIKTGAYFSSIRDTASDSGTHLPRRRADMGTEDAPLTLDDSVPHIVRTLTSLRPEDNGRLLNYRHEILPW